MLKRNPTIHDQHAWAMGDSRNAHRALEAMLDKLYRGEVTPEDCRPFFEICQRLDQKLLDIEATIRREHIRTLDTSAHPAKEDRQLEVNIQIAIRYLNEM